MFFFIILAPGLSQLRVRHSTAELYGAPHMGGKNSTFQKWKPINVYNFSQGQRAFTIHAEMIKSCMHVVVYLLDACWGYVSQCGNAAISFVQVKLLFSM